MKRKFLKSVIALGAVIGGLSVLSACSNNSGSDDSNSEDMKKIGILQYMEHASLDDSREGFIDALAENGYVEGENVEFDIQNAQGDQSNLKSAGEKLVNNNSDLILAIATPAAQSLIKETQDIPILFTAVTDAVEANIVDNNEKPGGNVSGTVDMGPIADQVKLLVSIVGEDKSFGILYTSNEDNSRIQSEIAIEAFEELGITPEVITVANTTEVQQAAESMADKVDGIFIPTDNTFASAMTTVGNVAIEKKIPVVASSTGQIDDGGLATVGISYYELGKQTGEMAVKILNGEAEVGDMAVEEPTGLELYINEEMAEALGIDPSSIKLPE